MYLVAMSFYAICTPTLLAIIPWGRILCTKCEMKWYARTPERANGEAFEEWTERVAVLRELEIELTEASSLEMEINKLQIATWGVGNGVEI